MKPADLRAHLQFNNRLAISAGALLIGAIFYGVYVSNAYFENSKQIALGWGCAAIIFFLEKSKIGHRQPWRIVLIVFAGFLAVRYMWWRTVDSLIYTGFFDFIGMALLYLAETYGFVIYMLGLFVNVWPMETKHVPLPEDQSLWPTVDVFIPTYNEPEDIIRITVTAATQLDYPKEKLRVFILDDGGTLAKRGNPQSGEQAWDRHYSLRHMAEELGVGYITRETNQKAKAGNINHALHHTDSDLVLILDCDHVPTRDFLVNTAGHFVADPKLFLVQTPHFFINPAPIEKSLSGIGDPSTESDLFYRRIHSALNFWNASYFCGSAALLRRKYLMEVGGICGTTITEDAETAFYLHGRGYNSVYINKPMICGLSPESYDDYVSQHSRWAQGMVQLLLLNNPLRAKGLALSQRLAYFNSCVFWLFSLPRFIYFLAPASYLILGLNVYHASWIQIFAFTVPYIITLHLMMDYFYTGTRPPLFSEIYETVQSLFLIPAVLSVLLNPWNPTFKVTPKGKINTKEYLSPVSSPFFIVIAINVIAFIAAIFRWYEQPTIRDVIIVTALWCAFNVVMVVLALGAFWERKQVRKYYRIGATGSVTVDFPRMRQSISGQVRDVSLTGVSFEIAADFTPHELERVVLNVKDSYGQTYAFDSRLRRTFRQNGKLVCGSEFVNGQVSYAQVVAYVYGDSQRWADVWDRKSKATGSFRMLWAFSVMGLQALRSSTIELTVDAIRYVWKFGVRLFTTPVVRERLSMAFSWCVYYFYLSLAAVLESMDKKKARKLQRNQASGQAEIYFPRLNATVIGEISDTSLTGIGVLAALPFRLEASERVFVSVTGGDSHNFRFDCQIMRVVQRGDKSLCGAEFMTDVFVYPQIVRFVHGSSMEMIRSTSLAESRVAAKSIPPP